MNELSPIKKIPGIVQNAVYEDDPEIAFNEMRKLNDLSEMVEEAKGIFIYEMSEVWDQFSISKRESLQAQAYLYLDWHPHTVDRYMTLGQIRPQLPEEIQNKPIRELSPIAKTVSQGYEISDENFSRLEKSTSLPETYAILREVKNKKPKKGSLQIYIDESGTVYCWYDSERYNVGYLDINSIDLGVVKSIHRIILSTGIIRR